MGELTNIALEDHSTWLQMALDMAHVHTWAIDLASGRIVISEKLMRLLEIDPAPALALESLLQKIHPDDNQRIRTAITQTIELGIPFEQEYRVILPNGSIRWFMSRGDVVRDAQQTPLKMVGITIDVTEQKESSTAAQQRAEDSADQLRHLHAVTAALSRALTPAEVAQVILRQGIDSIGAVAGSVFRVGAYKDKPVLRIVDTIGYPESSVKNWNWIALDQPTPLTQCVSTKAPIWICTEHLAANYPQIKTPTSPGHCAWAALPLIADDRVIGALGLSFDTPQAFDEADRNFMITLAHYCAQALERATLFEEAQHARKLSEDAVRVRDEFLGIASHELKNPLTGLSGNAQLLARRLKNVELPERDLRTLHLILEQAKRLNTMIEDLLDLSRLDKQIPFDYVPLNVAILVYSIVAEVEPSLQKHKIAVNELAADLMIEGNAMRLGQVLHNLLSNAIKYSPEGGQVSVTIDSQNDHAVISIADQGIGIPREELPNLFKRFYRVPNANSASIKGFGIGLYIVKEIVTRHGGHITVESTPGVGSKFNIFLPLVHDVK